MFSPPSSKENHNSDADMVTSYDIYWLLLKIKYHMLLPVRKKNALSVCARGKNSFHFFLKEAHRSTLKKKKKKTITGLLALRIQ